MYDRPRYARTVRGREVTITVSQLRTLAVRKNSINSETQAYLG
jgi:hypothetical protein